MYEPENYGKAKVVHVHMSSYQRTWREPTIADGS